MRRSTYSILFYLKRSKLNKWGEAPIYMRITIDGIRSEASINRSIKPEQWNKTGKNGPPDHFGPILADLVNALVF
jgi:hypothetical protein